MGFNTKKKRFNKNEDFRVSVGVSMGIPTAGNILPARMVDVAACASCGPSRAVMANLAIRLAINHPSKEATN